MQKRPECIAAQHRLHFLGQGQRVLGAPVGQYSGVYQQQRLPGVFVPAGQGLLAQPGQQSGGIGGVQHAVERVAPRGRARAVGGGQQVQVVVAQQRQQGAIQGDAAAQHADGIRPTVDQIAEQIHRVAAGRKADFGQQAFQGIVAALNITHAVKCHEKTMRWSKAWIFC